MPKIVIIPVIQNPCEHHPPPRVRLINIIDRKGAGTIIEAIIVIILRYQPWYRVDQGEFIEALLRMIKLETNRLRNLAYFHHRNFHSRIRIES